MSTIASTTMEKGEKLHSSRPSFFGLVGGELFKIQRQWATWIMLVLFMGLCFAPYFFLFLSPGIKEIITAPGNDYIYGRAASGLAVARIFGGFIVVILTARVIGQEYQLGTIRIVLARGVGRVQLLLAKLTALLWWALVILVVGLALNALFVVAQVQVVTGNLNALNGLDSTVWRDLGIYALSILISLVTTMLMSTAITVLFHSFVGGLSTSIAWFPADNIATLILTVAFMVTKNDLWKNISAYLLGPNLNAMAGEVANIHRGAWAFGQTPLVQIDGNHTLIVTAVYAAIFAVVAIVLTAKRDVKE